MNRIIKVVIALGGNALEDKGMPATAESQLKVIKETCEYLAEISCAGYEIAIVHGNGPQIGRLILASETAKNVTPPLPFDVCGAMTQGYIGYHIQQGLKYALAKKKRMLPVVTVITQVVVNKGDPAFKKPTKPIGLFYTEREAKKLEQEKGYIMKEDAGRGWRRVVPSPLPEKIVEVNTIKRLWNSTIVIACGGGGVPIIEKKDGSVEGIAAVIDKDLAAEKLAEDIDADILMILTEVERVSINFKKPNQQELSFITVAEAEKYTEEGHFAPGSMLPKIIASTKFVENHTERKAIITSPYKSMDALNGLAGTIIKYK
jgi:carbamate kinase